MKIAVFSDVHGNLEALEAIMNDINKEKYDDVICLGDVINIGPSSKECLERILNSNVRLLLGNHDLYFLKGLDKFDIEEEKLDHYKWVFNTLPVKLKDKLKDLPLFYEINVSNQTFRFCHYFIKNIKNIYPFYSIGTIKRMKVKELLDILDVDYIFYGHDHEPSHLLFNHKHLIDVGSSGCVKNNKTFYTVLNIEEEVTIIKKEVEFDRDKFEEKLKHSNYPMLKHYAPSFFGIMNLHK